MVRWIWMDIWRIGVSNETLLAARRYNLKRRRGTAAAFESVNQHQPAAYCLAAWRIPSASSGWAAK